MKQLCLIPLCVFMLISSLSVALEYNDDQLLPVIAQIGEDDNSSQLPPLENSAAQPASQK